MKIIDLKTACKNDKNVIAEKLYELLDRPTSCPETEEAGGYEEYILQTAEQIAAGEYDDMTTDDIQKEVDDIAREWME